MNQRPIDTAQDADLRLSQQAMQRAAQRARQLAAQTGTVIVISHQGVIKHLHPLADENLPTIQGPNDLDRTDDHASL